MNHQELEQFKDVIMEHCKNVQDILDERKGIKSAIEEHLKDFFTWNTIEYSSDFNCITLSWEYGVNPVIKHENIHRLGWDWIISADYDSQANRIVVIELYPFGVKEGELIRD